MPSILTLAKLKLLGRNKSRSKGSKAGDNRNTVNDTEKEKVAPPGFSLPFFTQLSGLDMYFSASSFPCGSSSGGPRASQNICPSTGVKDAE